MKKIIRTANDPQSRVSLDPYFEPLNQWGYNYFIKGTLDEMESNAMDSGCRQCLAAWNRAQCEDQQCSSCLFDKPQDWVNEMDFVGISSLCDLLTTLMGQKKIEKRKHLDFMDVAWARFKGSYGSNQ